MDDRRPGRVCGDAEEVNDPLLDFDHLQDLVAAEQHGVDGEESRWPRALGLGTERLAPCRTGSPGPWRKLVASQDVRDAAFGYRDAELIQLPDNAQVVPARVLPCQAHDQLDGLSRQGRGPGSRCEYFQRRRTSARCQRRIVSA
jgi:hypothetical protein